MFYDDVSQRQEEEKLRLISYLLATLQFGSPRPPATIYCARVTRVPRMGVIVIAYLVSEQVKHSHSVAHIKYSYSTDSELG